ncbi:enoyl-CoA hydratase-related protein [Nocardioides sp.]|uniref:enoyl-CoA hydratase-related protein n=1 Tax=Nocardioides sp. TaxID=35761 RepID=UPI002626885C|nr:enoyl-CoA hydratase-related protein [Nocardioides sp.]MDI6912477.1 enoyl-CoA hydratase-related protein [Nocardioides sp.]
MMDYTHILYEVNDGVATVTINRPKQLNAFDGTTITELTDAFHRIEEDKDVGVAVLTGAGERSFSAGGDVNWEAEGGLEGRKGEDQIKAFYAAIRSCYKPTIARINGYAIGGGHHMAYMCDLSIAADHAIFGQNGPRVASPAQGWLVSYLIDVIGAKRAREFWLLCRRYTAEQALDFGLVNAVVPMDQLDAEVRKWCDEILALSPSVIKIVKASFDNHFDDVRTRQDEIDFLQRINPSFWQSGEQKEGTEAFLNKRTPDFSPWR